MLKQTKCPQCGNNIFYEYNTPLECAICGWGKNESLVISEPSGLWYKIGQKSPRWKAGAVAAMFIAFLVITPLLRYSSNQIRANRAVALARSQMDKRLYASAVRTLNEAPRSQTSEATLAQVNSLLSDTVRWAHDISDVKTAKKELVASNPDGALDSLDEIDEDFPQEDEATDLVDLAQDQSIDPELEIDEETVDGAAYVPDDPEADNLDEMTDQAEQYLNDSPSSTSSNSQTSQASQQANSSTTDSSATTTDTGDDTDSTLLEEDLPQTPEDSPDIKTPSKQSSHLANLYQLTWISPPKAPSDQDSFYTIDFTNEVSPRKDRKSNFGGYGTSAVIGQVYNRKLAANSNIIPLYRYWNAKKTDHYYSTNGKFSANNPNAGYNRQAIAGYIGKWDGTRCLDGDKPLYNLYNSKLSDNYYTTNTAQKDAMVKTGNWTSTRVTGCIW